MVFAVGTSELVAEAGERMAVEDLRTGFIFLEKTGTALAEAPLSPPYHIEVTL